ncbi:hypothetical protein LC612_42310 [Nostoc sp. CHAB 5834]|nr:hypothetical protein [Nostoc sp. CHAB 5834]
MNQTSLVKVVDYKIAPNEQDGPVALGRNGVMAVKAIQLFVNKFVKKLTLEPINSRGVVGRCSIEVPLNREVLYALAAKITEVADALPRNPEQDRTP